LKFVERCYTTDAEKRTNFRPTAAWLPAARFQPGAGLSLILAGLLDNGHVIEYSFTLKGRALLFRGGPGIEISRVSLCLEAQT
jgi:hypothetical protein